MVKKGIKTTIAWLGYRTDSELFRESARAALRTFRDDPRFDASFVLLDDAWKPVDRGVSEWFEGQGGRRLVTTYRRTGMLLGGENFTGQCKAFLDAARMTGLPDKGLFVKTDCDTLHFKADWLADFAADDKADVGGVFDFGLNAPFSVFGFTYAIKGRQVGPLAADAEKYPAHHKAWEDHEVSSRIFRFRNGEPESMHRYVEGPESGLLCRPLDAVNDTWVNMQAGTFAWDYQTSADPRAFRKRVGEWMRRLNDLREGVVKPFEIPGQQVQQAQQAQQPKQPKQAKEGT